MLSADGLEWPDADRVRERLAMKAKALCWDDCCLVVIGGGEEAITNPACAGAAGAPAVR